METQTPLERAIEIAGGQSALAVKIGRAQGHIHYWLKLSKAGVPPQAAIDIENALSRAVTRHELRPDIFGPAPSKRTKLTEVRA